VPIQSKGSSERGRELTLATRCHADARNRCIHMALIKVHGESDYGAHRLPSGKTVAEKRERDVLQVRQRNRSKIDDIDYPRHQSSF
jgi:hypothetical protein